MRLFKMVNWNLEVEEAAWGIKEFKAILNRDNSKEKETALKEMLFIYSFADVKSDYNYITDEEDRAKEIKKDVGLDPKWEMDEVIKAAIDVYKERSSTIVGELYLAAVTAADGVKDYLKNTKVLLAERDMHGKPITKIGDVTKGLKDVKVIMQDLKAAYKEVIKEQKDNEGKTQGKRSFGLFEDGV